MTGVRRGSSDLARSGNSLVASRNVITKIYFPRLISPTAPILSNVIDFAVAFLVLIGLVIFYHVKGRITGVTIDADGHEVQPYHFVLGWQVLLLPVFLVLTVVTSLAVSLWLSALNAIYRDIVHVIPFLVQLWMLATPVVYPIDNVLAYQGEHPWLVKAYFLNPMVGVIEGFKWVMLGGSGKFAPPPADLMMLSTVAMLVLLIAGAYFFRRMERVFVDLV